MAVDGSPMARLLESAGADSVMAFAEQSLRVLPVSKLLVDTWDIRFRCGFAAYHTGEDTSPHVPGTMLWISLWRSAKRQSWCRLQPGDQTLGSEEDDS